jgi:monoamine oxidase
LVVYLFLLTGGYFQVCEHLIKEFPLDIRLEHVVRRIKYSEEHDNVTIECSNGEVVIADKCLVTIPVGVLQSGLVEFIPGPPQVISHLCKHRAGGLM